MKVCVVIPWRSQKSRIPAMKVTVAFYQEALQGLDFSIMRSDSVGSFNHAQARNSGVLNAMQQGADVVIIGDADTIPEKNALLESINLAYSGVECVLPFTEYKSLSKAGTLIYLYFNKTLGRRLCKVVEGAVGSIYVIKPTLWLASGGQDARFRGWGGEDVAFNHAYKVLFKKDFARINGGVIALQHRAKRFISEENKTMLEEYFRINNASEMQNFLKDI